MASTRNIAIVGAGIGGLAAAIRLATAGHRVTVFEKNDVVGGRCGVLRDQGYTWDLGPTILLMPDVLREIFTSAGRNPADYIDLIACDPNYRIHFADGTGLTLTSNLARVRDELEAIQPGAFEGYLKFLQFGRHAYDTSVAELVSKPLDGPTAYLNPQLLATVLSVQAHRRLYPYLRKFFKDERLLRAMSFQTMYLGLSPYEAPATFALLPYTELAMGIWYTRGGLHALPRGMERLARELGVTFRLQTPVERIVPAAGFARGVQLPGGEVEEFDAVVANADLPYTYDTLIPEAGEKPTSARRFTSSAFMLYLGIEGTYDHLEHHNVVFGDNYKQTFREIFGDQSVPEDPSFYVNRPGKTDSSVAPAGHDALYVLVPVPHQTTKVDWHMTAPLLREKILTLMESRLKLPGLRSRIRVEHMLTPDGWADQFNLANGACFGLSHDFWQVGALRPSTRDRKFKNLYFVGASTQPGTGVPLVMLSAKIVAERFARELGEIPQQPHQLRITAPAPLAEVA